MTNVRVLRGTKTVWRFSSVKYTHDVESSLSDDAAFVNTINNICTLYNHKTNMYIVFTSHVFIEIFCTFYAHKKKTINLFIFVCLFYIKQQYSA